MMLLHFLQRILKTLPWTLSSEIEYLAWQASQTIFMVSPASRGSSVGPPSPTLLGEMIVSQGPGQNASRRPTLGREWIDQPDGLGTVRPDGDQTERHTG